MSLRHVIGSTLAALMLAGTCALPVAHADDMQPSTVKSEMLRWIGDAEDKLLELADATPQAKYTWRPNKEVRSTGEVFLHVAAANFGIPSYWGVTPPEGFKFDGYEQSMSKKEDIEAALKASFAHMKKSLEDADEATLEKNVKVFGMDMTVRSGYMLLLSHVHEHLGQSIAYARSNGIVPPWTARANAAAAAKKKEGEAKEEH